VDRQRHQWTVLLQLKNESVLPKRVKVEKDTLSERKKYRHHGAEEKLKLLKRHLVEKIPVSKVCEEAGVAPTQFYRWLEQLFANGQVALDSKRGPGVAKSEDQARIARLEKRIQQKDEVLAELMEEHVALKKAVGGR